MRLPDPPPNLNPNRVKNGSVSQEIRVLFNFVARGLQCVTAKNLKLVGETAGLDPLTVAPVKLKEALQMNQLVSTPPQDA